MKRGQNGNGQQWPLKIFQAQAFIIRFLRHRLIANTSFFYVIKRRRGL